MTLTTLSVIVKVTLTTLSVIVGLTLTSLSVIVEVTLTSFTVADQNLLLMKVKFDYAKNFLVDYYELLHMFEFSIICTTYRNRRELLL